MLIRLTPAIKSTPNDENINSISRWMTRNILFTLNRKLLTNITIYYCAKVLDYFATFFLIIYPIRIITALVMTLP